MPGKPMNGAKRPAACEQKEQGQKGSNLSILHDSSNANFPVHLLLMALFAVLDVLNKILVSLGDGIEHKLRASRLF